MSNKVKGTLPNLRSHSTYQLEKASLATNKFVATSVPFMLTPWLLGSLRLPRHSTDAQDLPKTLSTPP